MTEYRRATESERRRFGVEWRCVKSAWRTQRLASSYTFDHQYGGAPITKAAQLNTYLLVGDSQSVRWHVTESRASLPRLESRFKIMEARYYQWLAERDANNTAIVA